MQVEVPAKDWEGLQAVLACSDGALRQVVQRWPSFASLPPLSVMHRLLCLKVETKAACQTRAACVERPFSLQEEKFKKALEGRLQFSWDG